MAAKASVPADWIALLIEKGEALRKAGLTSLVIGDVSATFAPWDPPAEKAARGTADDEGAVGALDDAATYGRREGVPGFTRPNSGHDEGDFR